MAPEVAALAARGELEAAATLAEKRGEHQEAAVLWERACAYAAASRAALAAGDAGAAIFHAARAGDRALERNALSVLAGARDGALAAAARLSSAGHHAVAGRTLAFAGLHAEAAPEFERAGLPIEAAFSHERSSAPREAARCLTAALAADGARHDVRLALGELLAQHGRIEESVRALQQIPPQAPEHAQARRFMIAGFLQLGMPDAARELHDAGADVAPAAPDRTAAQDTGCGSRPASASTTRLFGRYQTRREVARTPSARVLLADDVLSGEPVAIKLFSPEALVGVGRDALRRFENEARALGALRHPAIVRLRELLPAGPALVLEWMPGGSLADRLEAGPLSPARAVEVTRAVLSALSEAHRRGILHRDVKPSNVLFDAAGAPKLADFGTAHVADAAATVTRGVIGTLSYLAPEQRAGAPATPASDVYGAGALLWHALTGGPPEEQLPFLSEALSLEQRALAERFIAGPGTRPSSAAEALELIASSEWPRAVPTARASRAPVSEPPQHGARLVQRAGVLHTDQVLGRELLVLAADPAMLARVRPWARVSHPSLPAVLCHKTASGVLWIEAIDGEPIHELDQRGRGELSEALSLLHAAAGWHGAVDREHICRKNGRAYWRFPLAPRWDSPALDRAALEAL